MFDDTTTATAQPTNDPGISPEPAPGGVLGPDSTSAAAPAASTPEPAPIAEPAVAAPAEPTVIDPTSFNTTPMSSANEPIINPLPAPDSAATSGVSDDLVSLKQQALQSLSPLLSHLEQTPEEKFKTTMMMIQASDDQSLVKTAYDAAQAITDEKEKAQALLDIVNEINYFTQQAKG